MSSRQQRPTRPPNPRDVLDEAVSNNSVSQLGEALELVKSNPPRNCPYEKFQASALSACVQDGKFDLVRHLLEQEKVPVASLSPRTVWSKFSIPLLELLISHGWDINQQTPRGPNDRCRRLVDLACHDQDIITWLVDHGARVDGGEYEYEVYPQPPPLLETCALQGSLSTFRYLQERGARLSRRTLHLAAGAAAALGVDPSAKDYGASDGTDSLISDEDKRKKAKGEILRFLVDDLKLDVNATDTDIPHHANHWGTPLCYAATKINGEAVVRWLLEKGADPRVENSEGGDAEYVAKDNGCDKIVSVIQEWKKAHD
ncbi:hypothetical protein NM208_g545 [Fusarium decemcellulare]|uniref:Uncharacterized protein n=1 Tax=Fusarium decemcellulare TaxID=57161 RepID=A0ACC1SZC7_9HYPO|nr:hypothetical protein NM208_g545 [Fusarium decemcellulare]